MRAWALSGSSVGLSGLTCRVAPCLDDLRAVGLLAGEDGLGGEVADGEPPVGCDARAPASSRVIAGRSAWSLWSSIGLKGGDGGGMLVPLLCNPFSFLSG